MGLSEPWISCDWGTTNFRLQVVDAEELTILHEYHSRDGIKTVFEQCLDADTEDRQAYFLSFLLDRVQSLPEIYRKLSVVSSGMISSNLALGPVPYASFPLSAGGQGIICEKHTVRNRSIWVISGVHDEDAVMRGEEVQAVGLADKLPESGTLILPGTHSKHLTYDAASRMYTSMKSYMTGELFSLFRHHSILSGSVEAAPWDPYREGAFFTGLERGFAGNAGSNYLSIRGMDLLGERSGPDNYYFLSGLLIGDELSGVPMNETALYLAAGEPLLDLYDKACNRLFGGRLYHAFDQHELDLARIYGQDKIMKNHG